MVAEIPTLQNPNIISHVPSAEEIEANRPSDEPVSREELRLILREAGIEPPAVAEPSDENRPVRPELPKPPLPEPYEPAENERPIPRSELRAIVDDLRQKGEI